MLLRLTLLMFLLALAGGCEMIRHHNMTTELNESSKAYNRMIRWNELDRADALFPAEKLREEFKQKVKAAKDVRVTDYRVKSVDCFPEKGEATVIVDIDYYREPSVKLKTVEDVQKWNYVEENGKKRWRLMTLPPDFQ